MADMSDVRNMILKMSDEQLERFLKNATSNQKSDARVGVQKPIASLRWFEQPICGLPKEGLEYLKEAEAQLKNPSCAHQVDRKRVRYGKEFKSMKLEVPDFYKDGVEVKSLFKKLRSFCTDNDLPEEIVEPIVPSLIDYINSGHMRPVIFIGEKGCGKTTAARLLLKEALKIPTEVIKVPEASGGHGMTGDSGIYISADVGSLAKAQLRNKSLIVGYIFDEIDKATPSHSRANIDDELLSITDESVADVIDNYMECTLVGLPYCPMFFTGNDLNRINPILVDRCTVVRYPNANADRIKSIMKKFTASKLQNGVYSMIDLDYEVMNRSIDSLAGKGVTSLRKHQQMIENALGNAFRKAMEQEDDALVQVTESMFRDAESAVIGAEYRRVGFGA